ncbi:MAG: hypothetical protein QME45_12725 [Clostridiales bacterium]|nr:hypothetical protein [Clostridiales bacterium]
MNNSYDVNVDLSDDKKSLKKFYNAVGYANTDYTYTEPTKKMYDYLSSFNNHFQYVRMHNILTSHGKGDYYFLHGMDYGNPENYKSDCVVSMDDNDNISFNWEVVDKVYDILVEHNMRPIVETVYMPYCLQKSQELHFIPKDLNLWYKVLHEFVIHLQNRYGKEEVEKWYFEIWNEPDGEKYWIDDPSTFFAMYDYMEYAVHSVDPLIKVGGPATKQWSKAYEIFTSFLKHCSDGLNFATGKFGTRIDFISVHCKGGHPEFYNPSSDVMFDSLKIYLDILKKFPKYENIEFFNDESDIVWEGNQGINKKSWLNFRNTHYASGFTCKMVNKYCDIVEDIYNVNLSLVVSDNCHLQWERFLFSGNRSQFTPLVKYPSADLLKKPIFNAYVLLSHLGNERLHATCPDKEFGEKFGVLPTIKDNILSIMLWNFEDGIEDDINDRILNITLKDMPFKAKYKLIHYRIDKDHSNSYSIWKLMGRPDKPSVEQIKSIREGENLELYQPVKDIYIDKKVNFKLLMPMHAVSLLLFVPENSEKPEKSTLIKSKVERGINGNLQVFLKWKPNVEDDFLYYRLLRRKEGESEFKIISDNTSLNTSIYIDMDVKAGCCYYYKIISINASMKESNPSDEFKITII